MVKKTYKTTTKKPNKKSTKKRVTRKPTKAKRTTKKTTTKSKRTRKTSKRPIKRQPKGKVQRGGIPSGGTSFDDLPNNLMGLVEYTVNSVSDLVESAWYTLNIGDDVGTAFGPNEPDPSNVKIPPEAFD